MSQDTKMTSARYPAGVVRPLLISMALLLAGCAEPEPELPPLEGAGVFQEQAEFEPPPPLRPTAVEIKKEEVKPPWKSPPVSVLDQNTAARGRAEETRDTVREVDRALDETEGDLRQASSRRRRAERAETAKAARTARAEREEQEKTQRERLALAEQAAAKAHTGRVEAYLAEAERRAGDRGHEAAVAEAYALREAALRTASALRRDAEDARRNAARQQRFVDSSLGEGVYVPGSRQDARRAAEDAGEHELRAEHAEALAKAAAEAHRRLLLGKD